MTLRQYLTVRKSGIIIIFTFQAEHMNHLYEDKEPVNFPPHVLQTITEEEFDDEDTYIVEGELFLTLVTSNRHHAKIM